LTTKFDRRVTLPLADVLGRVTQLQDQVTELTELVRVQVETGNQTTELLGRLLASHSSRLEVLEDSVSQPTEAGKTAPEPIEAMNDQPRRAADPALGSEEPVQL
jgi:hypothetical protein